MLFFRNYHPILAYVNNKFKDYLTYASIIAKPIRNRENARVTQ